MINDSLNTDHNGLTTIQQDHPELDVQWVAAIDSTQHAVQPNALLITEQQLAGVGRRGNSWLAVNRRSISCSYRFNLSTDVKQMSGYALTIALAIIQVMNDYEAPTGEPVKAQVKWPNDLYFEDKKFAGILINLKPMGPNQLDVTAGIGINWSLTDAQRQSVNQSVCNIPLSDKPPRAEFINSLIIQIKRNNQLFLQQGLSAFKQQWHAHDYLANKTIRLLQSNGAEEGLYRGIDEHGQLLVSIDGVIKHFSGGEVSVRTI